MVESGCCCIGCEEQMGRMVWQQEERDDNGFREDGESHEVGFINAPSVKCWVATCQQVQKALTHLLDGKHGCQDRMEQYIKSFGGCR